MWAARRADFSWLPRGSPEPAQAAPLLEMTTVGITVYGNNKQGRTKNCKVIRPQTANFRMVIGHMCVLVGRPAPANFGLSRKAQPGDTQCCARQKLRLPLRSFSARPSRHRPRPGFVASPLFSRGFTTCFPVPRVRRFIPRSAATFAPGPALVHHPIAGDERGRDQAAAKWNNAGPQVSRIMWLWPAGSFALPNGSGRQDCRRLSLLRWRRRCRAAEWSFRLVASLEPALCQCPNWLHKVRRRSATAGEEAHD